MGHIQERIKLIDIIIDIIEMYDTEEGQIHMITSLVRSNQLQDDDDTS